QRIEGDIDSRLPGTDPRLRRSILGVLARGHAGAANGLYGAIAFYALQLFVDTAETEFLDRHASLWGITRKAPTAATGPVTATGTDGTLIPQGTLLKRADAQEYSTDADGTISGGSVTLNLTASTAGAAGNLTVGESLSFVSPISGVDVTVTVQSGTVDGTDAEADSALQTRVLRRIQQPPHGGAEFDYETWALEVPGVTRAWVLPQNQGAGTVGVTFVRDNDSNIIPDAAEVQAVQDYIDDKTRRPVTAVVTVFAPTPVSLNFTIQLTPDTTAVRNAVQAELQDLLLREAVPAGTILISHIREAISIAAGETDHVLSSPAADVTHQAGELAVFGTITWV
ncbi:MAG: baseplate J/gp47 family protein, partial [Dehalococcoidia bacterium]